MRGKMGKLSGPECGSSNAGLKVCVCSPCGGRLGKIKLDPEKNQNHSLKFIGGGSKDLERKKILQIDLLSVGK